MRYFPKQGGWIEVIIGSMFSGKTTELIRRCDRMRRAGRTVQIFSHDDRFATDSVVSHNRTSLASTHAETAAQIRDRMQWDAEVIGVDEGQFYDDELVPVCRQLAADGKMVIVAGLDQDFRSLPFSVMTNLVAEAEFVDKLCAVCVRCGNPAIRNYRKSENEERIVIGADETYQALCRICFEAALDEERQQKLF